MAVFLDRFARRNEGSPVIYLSTGAWNVAPALTRFLSRHLYPSGALLLTDWGPTHDRWFRSGKQHKEENLRRLAAEFPDVRWLLVGDDGQHDEEIYSDFAHEHPDRVAAIAIRQLSTGEAVLAGGRSKAADRSETSGTTWVYAPDGAGIWSSWPSSASSEPTWAAPVLRAGGASGGTTTPPGPGGTDGVVDGADYAWCAACRSRVMVTFSPMSTPPVSRAAL